MVERCQFLVLIFGLAVFSLIAAAKHLQTVLLGRFFGGFVDAAHLAVVAASLADLFNTTDNEVFT
jgi:MFS transporter, DHA1 family, multidrug resistance protein